MNRPLWLLALCALVTLLASACAGAGYAEKSADYGGNYAVNMPAEADFANTSASSDARLYFHDEVGEAEMDGRLGGLEQGAKSKKVAAESPKEPPAAGEAKDEVPVPKERMIIYDAQLGLLVFKVDEVLVTARELNKKHGGWVQQSTSNSLTMRIPVAKFDTFVAELEALGMVSYKNVVGTDVTEEFFDLEIRMKNAQQLRERYIELLKDAKTVEASLAIEKELARLTGDIERMKGRMRFLRDRAAFSTVTLTLEKRQPGVERSRVPLPFRWLQDYHVGSVLD